MAGLFAVTVILPFPLGPFRISLLPLDRLLLGTLTFGIQRNFDLELLDMGRDVLARSLQAKLVGTRHQPVRPDRLDEMRLYELQK